MQVSCAQRKIIKFIFSAYVPNAVIITFFGRYITAAVSICAAFGIFKLVITGSKCQPAYFAGNFAAPHFFVAVITGSCNWFANISAYLYVFAVGSADKFRRIIINKAAAGVMVAFTGDKFNAAKTSVYISLI